LTARADRVVRVPNAALHWNPPHEAAGSGEHGVWVIEGEELRRLPVHPGISDGEYTAVKDADLPLDARVIVELTALGRTAYGLGN
jgi:hypothetical protein